MSRRDIHYWKCDRRARFYGISRARDASVLEPELRRCLAPHTGDAEFQLEHVAAQGNHLIWIATTGTDEYFVRVEDGPERDDYLAVESWLLERLRSPQVPTPRVIACDASRRHAPFAWQILERIDAPDLQHWYIGGQLEIDRVATAVGEAVARWQQMPVSGFGPFDTRVLGSEESWEYFQQAGMGRVLSRYTWERTGQGYLSVVEAMLRAPVHKAGLAVPEYFTNPSQDTDIPLSDLAALYFKSTKGEPSR